MTPPRYQSSTLIGVLSDSHGHAAVTHEAVRRLIDAGATMLIHLGDIGSVEVLDALAGHPAHIVLGNCDWEAGSLARSARGLDITVHDPAGWIEADGRTIAFTHGHVESAVRDLLARRPDYFLHGHTHVARDERQDGTRLINPGALHRARQHTVALLNPAADSLQFIAIPR